MTERGFADVAAQSAHAFRAIMQAMARPGCVMDIGVDIAAPEPLLGSTAAVILTLCDFQTPVWLAPELRSEKVVHYLRFHTGAPITEEASQALFVIAAAGQRLPAPGLLLQGNHEYPDRSATIVIQTPGFVPGAVALTGPGIRGSAQFGVAGIEDGFWAAMTENHARFPIGVDVIFAAPRQLAALPRSTAIRMLETA